MAYDEYKELCKKVRKIDEKAADYMEELLAEYERGEISGGNFDPRDTLSGAFLWRATPQGHGYWDAIDAQLDDASSCPHEVHASTTAVEKFPVGTRVRLCLEHYNSNREGPYVGATGTVRSVKESRSALRGIRFDNAFQGGHRLRMQLPSKDRGHGWWVPIDKLEAVATDGTAVVGAAPAEEDDVRIPLSELEEEACKAQEQAEAAARAWDSVKGQDVAKQALREAVELPVLYSGLYAAYGKKASKGALLYGPPGCGKTMLGRMMAQAIGGGEAGFRYVKGGELFNRLVGAEEQKIREIFSEAKRYKACTGKPQVVFFDEADALFPKRTGKADRGHSYDFMASAMGAFLSELDGMEDSGAFVILATNRQEVLDPALLRDGRIDRKIMVERPSREVCGDILRACLGSVPGFEERFVDVTLEEVYSPKRTYYIAETDDKGNVRVTFGSSVSGAVITGIAQRVINEALQRDIKTGSTVATGICEEDIHAAVEAAWKETLGLDLTWLVEEVVGAVKISNLRAVHGCWLGIHGSESNKSKLEITVKHNLNDGSEDKF